MVEIITHCHNCGKPQSYGEGKACDQCGFPLRPWHETPSWGDKVRAALRLVSPPYVEGADLSKWQGVWNIQKSLDNGLRYFILKATQNNFTDSRFDEYANLAYNANAPFAVFHFADPSGDPAVKQARYFCDVVKGVGNMGIRLDAEWTGGLSPSALNQWFYDFLGECGVHLPNVIKGIYTRILWWNLYVAPASWAMNYLLWAARWADWLTGPWSDGKYVPRDWNDWAEWQYSADGNGLGYYYGVQSNSIDLDRFNGTWEQFLEFYGLIEKPDPEPHTHPEIQDQLDAINVRLDDLEADVESLQHKVGEHETRIIELEKNKPQPPQDTIRVEPIKEIGGGGKAVVFNIVGYDKACEGQIPPGKPIMEPPPTNVRVVYREGESFSVLAKAYVSCKCNPGDPYITASNGKFLQVAEGQPGTGGYVRADKVVSI